MYLQMCACIYTHYMPIYKFTYNFVCLFLKETRPKKKKITLTDSNIYFYLTYSTETEREKTALTSLINYSFKIASLESSS